MAGLRSLAAVAAAAGAAAGSPWPPSAYSQAAAVLAQMTLDQKLSLVRGYGGKYVGDVPGIGAVNIPPQNLEDGPQGVADGVKDVTAWPSALTVVMSWNRTAMYEYGAGMSAEQYIKGTNVMLGPAVNLARVPWGGRTFEYTGEDPHLAGHMVYHEVLGIQSLPVLGCVKHFVDNNQEYNRNSVSEQVDRRPQVELYYQAFAHAVDAGVGSAMCSYNRINDTYACENPVTLGDLKNMLGFKGWVMSDWGATHSTVPAAVGGLDQQMPDASYFGAPLAAAVAAGNVSQARIDDMVTRMLVPMFAYGLIANPPNGSITANATSDAHNALARQLAMDSITLLKNDGGLLPIAPASIKSMAIFGDATTVHGGGSGGVVTPYVITPQQGIQALAPALNVTYNAGTDAAAAAALAASVDVAVIVVATTSSEGSDRKNLSLPSWQDALVAAVVAANKRTVVVARCPGACLMPWRDAVPSILFELMPGQESGNSIAATIFGANNPSGKLPVSFPNSMTDTWLGNPVNPLQYPGTDRGKGWLQADYTEGLFFGYRWYDAQGTAPLWEFGRGLSYTSFSYSNLAVNGAVSSSSNATVTFTVTNAGGVAGAEVPQMYLAFPAAAGEPPQLLRGFTKIALAPGASAQVLFPINARDVSIFDVVPDDWRIFPGVFGINVGSSSRDLRLTGTVTVSA